MVVSSEKRWVPIMAYRDGKSRPCCFTGDASYAKCRFLGWIGDTLTCAVDPEHLVEMATRKTYLKKKVRPHNKCPVWKPSSSIIRKKNKGATR